MSVIDPKRTLVKQTGYSIEMQNSIKTPREFFDRVVTPDWEELKKTHMMYALLFIRVCRFITLENGFLKRACQDI